MKNKVTQSQVDNIIKHSKIDVKTVFDKVTVVTCKLPNGFVLVESSGAVDKANYDVEMGRMSCMTRITNKIWELEGYHLASMIHALESKGRHAGKSLSFDTLSQGELIKPLMEPGC
ncbi:hypothetical protein CPR19088_GLDEOEPO_01353 [Companilactobacillus paralimentarius]